MDKMNPDERFLKIETEKQKMHILFSQFLKNPNADRFGRLERSMLEYQNLMCNTESDESTPWTEDKKIGETICPRQI